MRVWKATGRKPRELQGACPLGFEDVWAAFCRLSRRRAVGMTVLPISYLEMDAFCRLTGAAFARWQVELIERLDEMWIKAHG